MTVYFINDNKGFTFEKITNTTDPEMNHKHNEIKYILPPRETPLLFGLRSST